jgi:hypothetical protein
MAWYWKTNKIIEILEKIENHLARHNNDKKNNEEILINQISKGK